MYNTTHKQRTGRTQRERAELNYTQNYPVPISPQTTKEACWLHLHLKSAASLLTGYVSLCTGERKTLSLLLLTESKSDDEQQAASVAQPQQLIECRSVHFIRRKARIRIEAFRQKARIRFQIRILQSAVVFAFAALCCKFCVHAQQDKITEVET